MTSIDITFPNSDSSLRLDVEETTIGDYLLNLEQASELCEAWADATETPRGWTIPDNEGDYNGIVLAHPHASGRSIGVHVWDESELEQLADGSTSYKLSAFPFAVTATRVKGNR